MFVVYHGLESVSIYVKLEITWRGGEEVTQESAKLPCRGSIPLRASKKTKGQLVHW